MWDDSSYGWVVVCKNHIYHFLRNLFYRHQIIFAETYATISHPPVNGPFNVRCDMCGKGNVYKRSDVLRIKKEIPDGFVPHPLFCDGA
jgi:hypothetical protein